MISGLFSVLFFYGPFLWSVPALLPSGVLLALPLYNLHLPLRWSVLHNQNILLLCRFNFFTFKF